MAFFRTFTQLFLVISLSGFTPLALAHANGAGQDGLRTRTSLTANRLARTRSRPVETSRASSGQRRHIAARAMQAAVALPGQRTSLAPPAFAGFLLVAGTARRHQTTRTPTRLRGPPASP